MSRLSAHIFAEPLDLAFELTEEWGVKLKVLEPTAERRAELVQHFVASQEEELRLRVLYPALLIACVVDPDDDSPVFADIDAPLINEREGQAVERLALAAMRVSGLDEDAVEAPKADSSVTPSDEASTTSPSD
jgi:hypothetical protein